MKTELVWTFSKADGMISHVKFLKELGGGGECVFFIRDTQYIVRLNMTTKEQEVIGKTPDSIIAFNVSFNKLRFKDRHLRA